MNTKTTQISCFYADCCYSDFLQDHYGRENQLLLVTSVFPEMTKEDIVSGLQEFFNSICTEKPPESITGDQINSAIAECFKNVTQQDIDKMIHHIDFPEPDDESAWDMFDVNVYAYLEWDSDENI